MQMTDIMRLAALYQLIIQSVLISIIIIAPTGIYNPSLTDLFDIFKMS